MGSDDFTYFTEKTAAAIFVLGIKNETLKADQNLHSPYFFIDEDSPPVGAALHAAAAMSYFAGHDIIELQAAVNRFEGTVDFMEEIPLHYPVMIKNEALYEHAKKVGEALLREPNVELQPVIMEQRISASTHISLRVWAGPA
ncbi:hypothetical protein ACFX15_013436 [Malus domestica]